MAKKIPLRKKVNERRQYLHVPIVVVFVRGEYRGNKKNLERTKKRTKLHIHTCGEKELLERSYLSCPLASIFYNQEKFYEYFYSLDNISYIYRWLSICMDSDSLIYLPDS